MTWPCLLNSLHLSAAQLAVWRTGQQSVCEGVRISCNYRESSSDKACSCRLCVSVQVHRDVAALHSLLWEHWSLRKSCTHTSKPYLHSMSSLLHAYIIQWGKAACVLCASRGVWLASCLFLSAALRIHLGSGHHRVWRCFDIGLDHQSPILCAPPFTSCRRREVDTAACRPADSPAQTPELLQNAKLLVRGRRIWARIQNVQKSSLDVFFF